MRALFDWLERFIEPYVSYRFVLALVFLGLFVYDVTATVLTVRDLGRTGPDAKPREERLGRILRQATWLLALRACSWSTVRRHGFLLLQIAVLAGLAIAINIKIYMPR